MHEGSRDPRRIRSTPLIFDISSKSSPSAILSRPSSFSKEQRWIPVSEELPEQGQEVICQCRANMIKVLKLDADFDWYQDADHCYMNGFVIAWMPLPEPYKAESETAE